MAPTFPSPSNSIDWTDPGKFAFTEANGHIESTFDKETEKWSPLKFVADSELRVHGLATGLNYGQQAFEGIKAFQMSSEQGGGIVVFRPEAHAARFQHSSDLLGMPPVPVDLFVQACNDAVALNAEFVPPHESGWSLYCRPLIFGSGCTLSPSLSAEYTFCVFVFPIPWSPPAPVDALILDECDRASPRGTGTAKAGGNYAGVLRWTARAKTEGFGITLHLDSVHHEYIDEFSLCGFLGVKYQPSVTNGAQNGNGRHGSVTLVVPESASALESVTSDAVQQIARSWGWQVEKRPVPYTELPEFDEVIGTGTAVGLTAIRSICRRGRTLKTRLPPNERVVFDSTEGSEVIEYIPHGCGAGGPVVTQLLAHLRAIQFGKEDDDFGWLWQVRGQD